MQEPRLKHAAGGLLHFPLQQICYRYMGDAVKQRRKALCQIWAVILIGAAPIAMVIVPWTITTEIADWQVYVRTNSFAIPLLQFWLIMLLMALGFSPFRAILNLPRLIKLAVLIWLPTALYTSFQPGNDFLAAFIGFAKIFLAGLFVLGLVDYRPDDPPRWYRLLWFAIGSGTIFFAAVWYVYIAVNQPTGGAWVDKVPGFNNIRHLAFVGFVGFVSGITCHITSNDGEKAVWRWCIPLLFATVGLGIILWTGSRGPLLACAIVALYILALISGSRRRVSIFLASALLVATAGVSALPVPNPIYGIPAAIGIRSTAPSITDKASSGRLTVWQATIVKISQKPVLGWGVEQFATSGLPAPIHLKHPHNTILQILFAGGLVSLFAGMLGLASVLSQWTRSGSSTLALAGRGCVLAILVYAMYDGVLYFSYPIMIFLVALATMMNSNSRPALNDK